MNFLHSMYLWPSVVFAEGPRVLACWNLRYEELCGKAAYDHSPTPIDNSLTYIEPSKDLMILLLQYTFAQLMQPNATNSLVVRS